jgi:hypothetical protein
MSTDNPDRTIGGLPGRTAMSRLARPEQPPLVPPDSSAPTPSRQPAPAARSPRRPKGQTTTARPQVSAYVDQHLRSRAQAAYKATSHLEGDRSWSEFVATALLAETERREAAHNHGEPFPDNGRPRAPGRPLN